MNKDLYELKKILYNLENKHFPGKEIELLDHLIATAHKMKNQYIEIEKSTYSSDNIQVEKISEENFLYKPVLVKNYYEGDYLERFGESRSCDLKNSNLLDVHNKFWKAYEVQKGNIFASIPQALADTDQVERLKYLGWDSVRVDVYEIKKCRLNRADLRKYVERFFKHHVLVLEVYSNTMLILNYKL